MRFKDLQYSNKVIKLMLFAVSFVLYANTLNHGFTLDDALVLTENRFTKSADFLALLTQDTFSGFFADTTSSDLIAGGRYRPLTLVIFAVLWQISEAPFIFHLLNVLFYAFTVLLVFSVVKRLVEKLNFNAEFVAGLTAVLFAVHPVHTEVVNNIKSLDEILSLMLGLCAWLLVLRSFEHQRNSLRHKFGVMLFYLLALLAKETAVVLLPIIGLSLYVFKSKTLINAVKASLPLLLGFVIYIFCRALVIGEVSTGTASSEPLNNPFLKLEAGQWLPFSFSEHAGTIAYVMHKYLYLSFMPIDLTHDYYPNVIPITAISSKIALGSSLIYAVLLALSIYGSIKRKLWGFAISVYLIALLLFSNVFFTIGTFMAERFLYVPSLGICLFTAWGLVALKNTLVGNNIVPSQIVSKVIYTLLIVLILLCCYKVVNRNQVWKSDFDLLRADQVISQQSAKLQNALGGELTVQSQTDEFKGKAQEQVMLEKAIVHLNKALAIHPTYALAYMIKGNAMHYQGKHQQAIENYYQALELNPNFVDAKNNLQKVSSFLETQQTAQSIEAIEQVAFNAIENNNTDQAIQAFTQLIELHNQSKHYFFRGVTYANLKLFDTALVDFELAEKQALSTDSENLISIWSALADIHLQLGNKSQSTAYQNKIKAFNLQK